VLRAIVFEFNDDNDTDDDDDDDDDNTGCSTIINTHDRQGRIQ